MPPAPLPRRAVWLAVILPALLAVPALMPSLQPSPALAQSTGALIGEALDKPIDIELADPLPEALRKLETKTDVPLKVDPVAWDLLPWGEQTTLTAKIKNQTLRQSLGAIAQKLGLTYTIGDQAVVLEPMPALSRLVKRATVQDLQALDVLASTELPPVPGVPTVRGVLTAVDVKLGAVSPFAIENRLPQDLWDVRLDVPRNATLLDALERLNKQTSATWYPWGKYMVVVPKETLVRDHLAKTVSALYTTDGEIGQVLENLRQQAGVKFEFEPGALQKVPADFRTVHVRWDNVTIAQALESLKGLTGLQYAVTEDGVKITNALPNVAAAAGGAGTDPVVAMMATGDGMQVMIRESQLPADVRDYLRHKTQTEIDNLRKMMEKDGYKPDAAKPAPATQPTNKPAAPAKPAPAGKS